MKRFFLLAAVATMFAACESAPDGPDGPSDGSKLKVTLENPSRVALNGDVTVWQEGDEVSVFNKNTGNSEWRFDGATGDKTGTISPVKEVEGSATENIVALYPYDAAATVAGDLLFANVAASQTLVEGSYDAKANLMVAVSPDENLAFKNLLGYVKINLSQPAKSIVLKGNNGEVLAGNVVVNLQDLSVEVEDSGATEIALDCESVKSGDYYIPVVPQVFEKGVTATVTYADDSTEDKTVVNLVIISRNTIYSIGEEMFVEGAFAINITEVTANSFSADIIPTNAEMRWLPFVVTKDYLEDFANDDELKADDIAYFKEMAEDYDMTLEEVIEYFTLTGEYSGVVAESLKPETEYVLYVYGLELDGTSTTPITYINVTTAAVEKIDVKFDVTATVDDMDITVAVKPSNQEAKYFFYLLSEEEVADLGNTVEEAAANYVEELIELYGWFGVEPSEVVEYICSVGDDAYTFEENLANTTYYAFAVALDDGGNVASDVAYAVAKTGDVAPSSNVITVSVDEINSNSIVVSTQTTNDDPYFLSVEPASYYAGMTDAEIVADIVDDYGSFITDYMERGNITNEYTYLEPETEYLVLAFGIHGGVTTTAITKISVTTAARTEADLDVALDWPENIFSNADSYSPDENLGFVIEGSNLVSGYYGLWKTSDVEETIAQGMTLDEIVSRYGEELSSSVLGYIEDYGYYGGIFSSLDAATSYTLIVKATDASGLTAVKSESCTTDVAAVIDESAPIVGKYTIYCSPAEGVEFTNSFSIVATDTANKYICKNFGFDNCGTTWFAYYDEAAGTLTLDGVEANYPEDGNFFAQLYGYWDMTNNEVYAYCSYDSANSESQGNDPCVMVVDSVTKKVTSLRTTFTVPILNYGTGEVVGYAGYYDAGSAITLNTAAASKAAVKGEKVKFNKKATFTNSRDNIKTAINLKSVNMLTESVVVKSGVVAGKVAPAKVLNQADLHKNIKAAKADTRRVKLPAKAKAPKTTKPAQKRVAAPAKRANVRYSAVAK